MDDVFIKFRDKFIEEALELVEGIEKNLMQLEINSADNETFEEVFRFAHTLKGVSGMYGFEKIADYTHKLESLFDCIRNETIKISTEIIDLTLQSADHVKNLLFDFDFVKPENQKQQIYLIEKLDLYVNDENKKIKKPKKIKETKNKKIKSYYILFTSDDEMIFRGVKIMNIFKELAEVGNFKIFKHQSGIIDETIIDETENTDAWGIILTSKETVERIDEVFMFVEDNYKLYELSENNLLDDKALPEILDSNNEKTSFHIEDLQNLNKDELTEIINENFENKTNNINKPNQFENKNDNNFSNIISQRINVDTAKLDTLMYLVSEFVTSNAQLKLGFENTNSNQLKTAVEKMEKLSKQFRENAFSLRLIPIQENIVSFQRLVRDLSNKLNKKIKFEIEGGDTELDKSILDKLIEPLMHLVRNSIDHGIENPQERIKAGKLETGTITFKAQHSGNNIIISIADDGCGINEQKILKKAIEKGLITKDKKLSQQEIFDLIFLPGLSTVESLSEISGRGVGMDVVKKKITELRGEIKIVSKKGKGSKFIIQLQQTVSIIDTLLFQTDDMFFTVPISDIEKCTLIETDIIKSKEYTATVPYKNKLIPYINLYQLYDLQMPNTKRLKLIVINKEESCFAIAADTIIGEHQAVLKSLSKKMKKQENIAGVSILGDGNIAYLLDTTTLQKIRN